MSKPFTWRRSALLVVALPFLCAPALPAQGGDDVARWLPAHTSIHIELNGGPCTRVGDGLALARIWAEPEMQQFVGRLVRMGQSQMQLGVMMLRGQLGLPEETLDALARGRMTVSLAGLVHGEAHHESGTVTWNVPDLVFTWDYNDNPDAIGEILSALETMAVNFGAAEFSDEPIEGYPVRRIQAVGAPFPVYYVVDGGSLIFASVRDTLAGCLQRRKDAAATGLAAQPRFAEARARTHRDNTVLFAFADLPQLLELLQGAMHQPELSLLARLLPYESLAWAEDLDGAGVWDRMFMGIAPDASFRKVFAERDTLSTPSLVPADVAYFSAWNLSYTGVLDWAGEVANQLAPGSFEYGLAEFQRESGLNLRDDLLAKLGPEAAIYASFPRRRLIPDVGLILESPDPAGLQGNLEKLIARALPGTPIRSVKFGQDTIRYASLSESQRWSGPDEMQPRPGWVVLDRYLVITLWPNAAKELLANLRGSGPTLPQNPDYAALAGRNSGAPPGMRAQENFYLDFQGLVEFALDNGWPVAQLMTPALPAQVPLDLADMPRPETITRHLFGIYGRRGLTDHGLYGEAYSPTGMALPVAMVVGGAAASMRATSVRQQAVMEAEMHALGYAEEADEY